MKLKKGGEGGITRMFTQMPCSCSLQRRHSTWG